MNKNNAFNKNDAANVWKINYEFRFIFAATELRSKTLSHSNRMALLPSGDFARA